jgi:predicted dehydrogenase
MSKLKWGIIGSGGIARRRTIPEGFVPAHNAHLVAVYGTNAQTNKEVARQFGSLAMQSLDALLASDVSAVYIASPVHAHLEQVRACARAGKHVFCEKPLGMNVAEAEEMAALCRKAGVHFGTAFMMRFQAQHQAAAKLVKENKLGQPVYARAQLSCWYPPSPAAWRQYPEKGGGGALIDMGNHCIDLLELFFGPVKTVSCFTNNTVHAYVSEDSAVVMLRFANGALGTVDVFFCIQDDCSKNALELYGSKGSIVATGTIGQGSEGKMIACLSENGEAYKAQQSRGAGQGVEISPTPINTYRAEIEAFSSAVLEGRSDSDSAERGLRSQRILAACYESAKTGRAMDVA